MEVWAGIVRVSAVQGRGGDSFHADRDQVTEVEAYAARRGARVEFMEPELSVSGGKAIRERPALMAAIEGVEAGSYQGIVVAYLSRLTRSRSGLEIWERVEAAGGHVHCAAEDLDTSTPNGRFIRDIHLANAVREREEHVERFSARRRHAAQEGVWAANVPKGYAKDPVTRHLVPGPDANLVRAAFEARGRGESVGRIASNLGMGTNGARRLLKSRVYLGEVHVGGVVNPAAHEPLVTPEQWAAANSGWRRPARGGYDGPALLAGIVRCSGCGYAMVRSNGAARSAYRCERYYSGATCQEPSTIAVKLADPYVEALALAAMDQWEVEDSEPGGEAQGAAAEVAGLEAELTAYQVATSALSGDFEAGMNSRLEALEAARRRLRLVAPPTTPRIAGARAAWPHLDASERNALLRDLLEVVLIRRTDVRGHVAKRTFAERVAVVRAGSGVLPPGVGRTVTPIPWPTDHPGALRELGVEDLLEP